MGVLLFVAVHGLLISVASCCGAQASGAGTSVTVVGGSVVALEHRLSSRGVQA